MGGAVVLTEEMSPAEPVGTAASTAVQPELAAAPAVQARGALPDCFGREVHVSSHRRLLEHLEGVRWPKIFQNP